MPLDFSLLSSKKAKINDISEEIDKRRVEVPEKSSFHHSYYD
jgi:hypothetical protein